MVSRLRSLLWTKAVLISSLVALLTSGCVTHPHAKRSDSIGLWENSVGGRMEFRDDGRFIATSIPLDPRCTEEDDPLQHKQGSGAGTWKLEGFPDEGPGAHIILDVKNDSAGYCDIWTVFTGAKPLSEMQLLYQHDDPGRFRRSTATSR
ncbi:hypothetical protein ACFYTC_46835 [Actinomadura nitritigenes]|uniref:hypothetical protein n=1 Tax=Actinomadura nitritigenes TaxID=134602 RepID=UPI0036AF3DC0